ncbi:MAG: metal ABC transporter permease [Verrucomicrobiae bacterium]|nr:metal ABC transporter permease [Verrucomicrobiae bacterium]
MTSPLLIPFQYEYLVKAIWVSALIGGVCGLLSCFITLKGWSLMGDALSHAVVPGVALAAMAGLPFGAGAFAAGLLAAGGMGFIRARTSLREDAVIGVVFTTFFAAGLLMISLRPSGLSLRTIILGNLLGISRGDILQVVVIAAITLGVLAVQWRDLVLYCFDPQQTRALGLNPLRLHFTLLTLLAATAVASLQAVGACLVVATLITPGATAYLLTDRFGRMMFLAGGLGAVTGAAGAYASYFVNGSPGGCIVVLQTLIFLTVLVFAPRHGMLAGRVRIPA